MFVLPFFFDRFILALQIQTLVKRSLIYSTLTFEIQHFHEAFNSPLYLTIKLLKSTFEYLSCPISENLKLIQVSLPDTWEGESLPDILCQHFADIQ